MRSTKSPNLELFSERKSSILWKRLIFLLICERIMKLSQIWSNIIEIVLTPLAPFNPNWSYILLSFVGNIVLIWFDRLSYIPRKLVTITNMTYGLIRIKCVLILDHRLWFNLISVEAYKLIGIPKCMIDLNIGFDFDWLIDWLVGWLTYCVCSILVMEL